MVPTQCTLHFGQSVELMRSYKIELCRRNRKSIWWVLSESRTIRINSSKSKRNVGIQMKLKGSAQTLFTSESILQYMEEVNNLLYKIPAYQELNQLYAGGKRNSFSSPDIDYYKLQYLKRYRFSTVHPKEQCECDTCEVNKMKRWQYRDWINVPNTLLNFYICEIFVCFYICVFSTNWFFSKSIFC